MSDCDVCIGGDVDGHAEFYRSSTPIARKQHRCEECGNVILKGKRYQYYAAKWDGDFSATHTCLECWEIQHVYSCGGAVMIGGLWEEMHDHAFEHLRMAGECWDSLTAPAKAKLLAEWRKWKGLVASK